MSGTILQQCGVSYDAMCTPCRMSLFTLCPAQYSVHLGGVVSLFSLRVY